MANSSRSLSSLRIAILGSGRIGSAFAFHLAHNAGHEVTLIARPNSARLAQLKRDKGVVAATGERAFAIISDRLDETIPYDLLIVTVKDYQIRKLLPVLSRCAAEKVQFMFMTFEPQHLQQVIYPKRSALGMPFLQSDFDEKGQIKISVGKRKTLTDDPETAQLLRNAGLPARHEPRMALWLRCHVPLGIAFESVAVSAEQRGSGASWARARTLARGLQACFALLQAQGYEIYPSDKIRLQKLPVFAVAGMLWGLSRIEPFRVLLATGKIECCALIDEILNSPVVPGSSINFDAIRAMIPE